MTRYVASLVGWEGSGTRGGSLLRGEQWSSRDARGDMHWWGLTRSRSVSVPRSRGDVISGGSAIHSSFSRSLAHSISPPRSFFISVPLFVSLSSSILSSLFLSLSLRFSLPITHSRPCFRTESQSEAEYSLYLSLFILFVYPFSLFSLPLSLPTYVSFSSFTLPFYAHVRLSLDSSVGCWKRAVFISLSRVFLAT